MRTVFGRLYSIYALVVFAGLFLLIFPFQLLFSQSVKTHSFALWFNRVVAWGFFTFMLVPVRIRGLRHLPEGQFIVCANHFSYLDIPALSLLPVTFKFVGKMSLSRIPLFGWMYKQLHVTVDRSSFKSRAHSLAMARQMVQMGFNMAFFPEGGVRFQNYPEMAPFRDGAFRLACEHGVPVVPVVMPLNVFVWPYDPRQLFFGGRIRLEVLEPISPTGNTEEDIAQLREQAYQAMQERLHVHAPPKAANIAAS